MEVTSEPSSFELLILIGGVISAILTIWKVMRMIKRASQKIVEGIESITKLFQLMQQEYSRNGGATHKDLLYKILEKQDDLIKNQGEFINELKNLVKEMREKNEKADS